MIETNEAEGEALYCHHCGHVRVGEPGSFLALLGGALGPLTSSEERLEILGGKAFLDLSWHPAHYPAPEESRPGLTEERGLPLVEDHEQEDGQFGLLFCSRRCVSEWFEAKLGELFPPG